MRCETPIANQRSAHMRSAYRIDMFNILSLARAENRVFSCSDSACSAYMCHIYIFFFSKTL